MKEPSFRISFPKAPKTDESDEVITAMGRLALAFSASEYYLALILMRFMGQYDPTATPEAGSPPALTADVETVFSIFYAAESTRTKRDILRNVIKSKNSRDLISDEWTEKFFRLLADHEKISRQRNKYIHTALSVSDKGNYVQMVYDFAFPPESESKLKKNWRVRENNFKVDRNMIDKVTERLAAWLDEAKELTTQVPTKIG